MTGQTDWSRRQRVGLLVLVLVGLGLRLYGLGDESLWYDESVSVMLAAKSLPAMLAHTAGDIHPPLYYALLHLWSGLAGAGAYAGAFLSLGFSLLLIPLTARLGRRLSDPANGLWAALLVALCPYQVWYAQELRMYTLGAMLGLLAWAGLDEALGAGRRRAGGWVLYALAAAVGLYTLYYFAFLLAALNLWALLAAWRAGAEGRLRRLAAWVAAQAGALALFAPWLPVAFRQATNPPVPPWRDPTPLGKILAEGWTALGFGQSVGPAQVWPLLALTALLALAGLVRLGRRNGLSAFLAAGYLLLPIALIVLISFWTPLYHVRYLFTYAPAYYVLVGAGLAALGSLGRRGRPLAWVALALLCAGFGLSLWQYHTDPQYATDDQRGAVQYLMAHWRPGDAVLINAGYVYPAVTYYGTLPVAWRGRLTEYGASFRRQDDPAGLALVQTGTLDGPAGLGWGDPASDFYSMDRAVAEAALTRLFEDYERVWVYRCYDTVVDPRGVLREWLDAHGVLFDETPAFAGLSNIRVQGYLTAPELPALAPATALPASQTFQGRLSLAALEGAPATLTSGESLYLALWWRAEAAPLPALGISVRLVDGRGHVWAQSDEQPLGSTLRTPAWPAGRLVRQPVRLDVPHGLAPGTYQVLVGVYEAQNGAAWASVGGEQLATVQSLESAGETAPDAASFPLGELEGGIELLAVEGAGETVQAGRSATLALTWRASAEQGQDLVGFLQAVDRRGNLIAAQEGPAADGAWPTSRWVAGQVVRETRTLRFLANTSAGSYRLIAGWYRPADGSRLQATQGLLRRKDYLTVGWMSVGARTPALEPPFAPTQSADIPFGAGIRLAGYDRPAGPVRPGEALSLTLLWQAVGSIERDYTVFCHLVGPDGQIWGQADGLPAGGALPTLLWMRGEYVQDAHTLTVHADAPAGAYRLLVGLYDPQRGDRPAEPAELGTLSVQP